MKTVKHFAKEEIEEILISHCSADGSVKKRKAEIIVETRQETTGDPRDPPYSVVSCIRAEVTEEP